MLAHDGVNGRDGKAAVGAEVNKDSSIKVSMMMYSILLFL